MSILGTVRQITSAARSIYDLLERQAHTITDYDSRVAKPKSKEEIKTTAKFVVSEDSQGYLIGKKGSFTKLLQDNGIYMKCYTDKKNRQIRPSEAICSMHGTFADIEDATRELIKRLSSFYEASEKDFNHIPLAVLVPFNYVTKIIGAKGCLIKELCNKTGANIRVCSDKDEVYTTDIVVTIEGSNEEKYRGAKAILEKVE